MTGSQPQNFWFSGCPGNIDAAGLESPYPEEHWSSSCSLIIAIREMSLIYKIKSQKKNAARFRLVLKNF